MESCRTDLSQPGAPQDEINVLIKFKISKFIMISTGNSVNGKEIYEKLSHLCYVTFTVPSRLCSWVMEEVEKVAAPKLTLPKADNADSSKEANPKVVAEPLPPLPCPVIKELLYYSSLCCYAVSTCSVANYRKFFANQANPHSFDEISMSVSQDIDEVDRYLIAVQGQTIYVAFQSEPTIQDWMTKYSSFSEGILYLNAYIYHVDTMTCLHVGLEKQTSRIPFIFFWERLRERKRIVFTGILAFVSYSCNP